MQSKPLLYLKHAAQPNPRRRAMCADVRAWLTISLGAWLLAIGCASSTCGEGLTNVAGRCVDPTAPPDCGEPCGSHAFCDGRVTPNACACAAGYEGDPCEWVGVIEDPGFVALEDDMGERFWVDDGGQGASVLPFGIGSMGDRGEGLLEAAVVCNAGALSQTIEMPSYALAEPLVAEVRYKAQSVGGFGVGFDRVWKELPETTDEWSTEVFCLGEGAYGQGLNGGAVKVRLSAMERAMDCFEGQQGSIRIDRFEIRPAAAQEACLAPGMVLNPDAEQGLGGWVFTTEGDAEGALVAGVGRDGTGGARLFKDAGAVGRAAMTTRVSVPTQATLSSPALRFSWRGASDRSFQAEVGTFFGLDQMRRSIERFQGNNAELNYSYCLPPWTHGNIVDLTFSLIDDGSNEATELVVDRVQVFSDPACGDAEDLLDAGFESAMDHRWLGVYLFGSSDQAVTLRADGTPPARSGEGVLELSYWTRQADMSIETFVLIPDVEAGTTPLLTFYSNIPNDPQAHVEWALGQTGVQRGDLATEVGWQCNEVPLPERWRDRWFRFQVRVSPTDETDDAIPVTRVFLDDFQLTTVGCPTP